MAEEKINIIGIDKLPMKEGFRRIAHTGTIDLRIAPIWHCGYFHSWHTKRKGEDRETVAIIEDANGRVFPYALVENQFYFIDK